jgi:peptidoglycan/xylan/chitin deacetylase (PgdA/CDA1 family)
MYHRVAEPGLDPCLLCVGRKQFAEQLEVLRKSCEIVPLRELQNSLRADGLRRPRVALTFDDGYVDNLDNAKPILNRFEAPATVFVTSGFVGTTREFWWDELDRLLLQPGRVAASLRLRVEGTVREWSLGDYADYPPDRQANDAAWSLMDSHDPTPRHTVYRELVQVLYTIPLHERDALLEELRQQTDKPPEGRRSHRVMSPRQVQELAAGGLVEVGAHTMSHPVLSAQPAELQRQEIVESKHLLETWIGQPVRSFAYPFGTLAHYSPATVDLVRSAGYTCACSNFPGPVKSTTDPFQLPRHMVFNWDGSTFSKHLSSWQSAQAN